MPRNLSDFLNEDRTLVQVKGLRSGKKLTENAILAEEKRGPSFHIEATVVNTLIVGKSEHTKLTLDVHASKRKRIDRYETERSLDRNGRPRPTELFGQPSLLCGALSEKYQKLSVVDTESRISAKSLVGNSTAICELSLLKNPYVLESRSSSLARPSLLTSAASLDAEETVFPNLSLLQKKPVVLRDAKVTANVQHVGPLFSSEDIPDFSMETDEEDDEEAETRKKDFSRFQVLPDKSSMSVEQHEQMKMKMKFLHVVSGSLISSPNYKNRDDPRRIALLESAEAAAARDPEFVFKVALYTRCNLNVRVTANFLLAYAGTLPKCRPYLKKYFSATVRLPTDWIDVAEHYELMSSKRSRKGRCPLPSALRKAMAEKFPDFDEYQLAKHNKQKKTNKTKQKKKKQAARKGVSFADWGEEWNDAQPDKSSKPAVKHASGQNLKKLVRQLHITKPAQLVMAIIGKRYPKDSVEFSRSGLLGIWDEEKAGKRMKLAQPETWETQISLKGNKAEVWESLLDRKKLPYMAMLRNLRNMIKAGISLNHHNGVLRRLQDENAVIHSKQFPFRFFSAYEVLETLREERTTKLAEMTETQKPKLNVGHRGKSVIAKKSPKWWLMKKKKNSKCNINYDETLLNMYQKALDNAVKVATLHNVKPIPGRTVVLCNVGESMDTPCTSAKGLGKPRTVKEIGVLLSLMCKYCCEDCKLIVYNEHGFHEVQHLQKGTILHNVQQVLEQKITDNRTNNESTMDLLLSKLQSYTVDRTRINNLLLVSDIPEGSDGDSGIQKFLSRFRSIVNPDLLYVNVSLSANTVVGSDEAGGLNDEKNVYVRGYSEQLLRFIAEKGTEGQMTFVHNIDRVYNLDMGRKVVPVATAEDIIALQSRALPDSSLTSASRRLTTPRQIRVFISSTFRDMHAERDILLRCVFPELQHRIRQKLGGGFTLCPIDLRWGITEEQYLQTSAVEQCLREVARSHIFVGILGERYGFCPTEKEIARIAEKDDIFSWLGEYSTRGLSVTELEMTSFCLRQPEAVKGRAFFYFRDPGFLRKSPVKYGCDMESESEDAKYKMMALKRKIKQAGHSVTEFSCQWAGVREGKPVVKGLKDMAESVCEDVWSAVKSIRSSQIAEESEHSALNVLSGWQADQWAYVRYEAEKVKGRGKLVRDAIRQIQKCTNRIMLVYGKAASGKTALMTKLASDFKNVIVIPCFREAWNEEPDPGLVAQYLTGLLFRLAGMDFEQKKVTVSQWKRAVEAGSNLGCRVLVFLDGWDDGQINWLLETHKQNLLYIVSAREGSSVYKAVTSTTPAPRQLEVESLAVDDRISVAKAYLAVHGKSLDDRAFNSQIRLLVSKRQADSPAYIHLACDYLRMYAEFDTLTSELRRLPSAVEPLIKDFISRLELDFGNELVSSILTALFFSPVGLTEDELYRVSSALIGCHVDTPEQVVMESIQRFLECPVLARSQFSLVLRAATILFSEPLMKIGLYAVHSLTVRSVVQKMASSGRGLTKIKQKAFLSLLASAWKTVNSADGIMMQALPSVERNIRLLIYILTELKAQNLLVSLLTDIRFVELCIRNNNLGSVMQGVDSVIFSSGSERKMVALNGSTDHVRMFKELKRLLESSWDFLQQYPTLLNQEILNEPMESTLLRLAASDAIKTEADGSMVLWQNKPDGLSPCLKSLRATEKAVTCLALGPSRKLAVGAADGAVSLILLDTGEELHCFTGHGQAVSGLCFLDDEGTELCSTSTDGTVALWNCKSLCKMGALSGHNAAVSVCRRFRWGKVVSLATGSWDTTVKLWNTSQRKYVEDIKTGSAVNCLDCHPYSSVILTGHWDGALRIYQTAPVKRRAVLRGHESSVRCAIYTENGAQIVSASMDGQIRVWSADQGITVGMFSGHSLPVTGMFQWTGNVVTVAEDCVVKVWSETLGVPGMAVKGRESTLGEAMGVSAVALNQRATKLATGFRDGFVTMRPVGKDEEICWSKQVGSLPIVRIKFLKSDNRLLIGGVRQLEVVNSQTGAGVFHLNVQTEETLTDADCTDSYVIATYSNGALRIFDLETAVWKRLKDVEALAEVFGHTGRATGCALSTNALSACTVGDDKSLIIWNTGKLLAGNQEPAKIIRNCHTDVITCCAWSVSKNLIVTGSNDCTVKCWNTDGNDSSYPEASISHHNGPIVSLSAQKSCIVSTSTDGSICVSSVKGALVTRLKALTRNSESSIVPIPSDCCLQIDDKSVAATQDDDIMDWAAEVELAHTETQSSEEKNVSWAYEAMSGSVLAVGFGDGSYQLWHPFLGHEKVSAVNHFAPITSVTGYGDAPGEFVTGDKNGVCNLWEMTGNSRASYPRAHEDSVTALRMSIDGRWLCSSALDGSLCLWQTPFEKPAFIFQEAHAKSISGVSWLKDSVLITGSEDSLVRIWTIDEANLRLKMLAEHKLESPVSSIEIGRSDVNQVIHISTWNGKHSFAVEQHHVGGILLTPIWLDTNFDDIREPWITGQGYLIMGDSGGNIFYRRIEGNLEKEFSEFSSLKAHTSEVTGIALLNKDDREQGNCKTVSVASVSLDRLLKIWTLNLETDVLNLSGCWRCPSGLSCVEWDWKNEKILVGDVIGGVHVLKRQ